MIVTSVNPVPIFNQPTYTVTYKENQAPPRMVIDLNSTDELLSIPVVYTIVSGNDASKWT